MDVENFGTKQRPATAALTWHSGPLKLPGQTIAAKIREAEKPLKRLFREALSAGIVSHHPQGQDSFVVTLPENRIAGNCFVNAKAVKLANHYLPDNRLAFGYSSERYTLALYSNWTQPLDQMREAVLLTWNMVMLPYLEVLRQRDCRLDDFITSVLVNEHGASDIVVEATTPLPQHLRIWQHGLRLTATQEEPHKATEEFINSSSRRNTITYSKPQSAPLVASPTASAAPFTPTIQVAKSAERHGMNDSIRNSAAEPPKIPEPAATLRLTPETPSLQSPFPSTLPANLYRQSTSSRRELGERSPPSRTYRIPSPPRASSRIYPTQQHDITSRGKARHEEPHCYELRGEQPRSELRHREPLYADEPYSYGSRAQYQQSAAPEYRRAYDIVLSRQEYSRPNLPRLSDREYRHASDARRSDYTRANSPDQEYQHSLDMDRQEYEQAPWSRIRSREHSLAYEVDMRRHDYSRATSSRRFDSSRGSTDYDRGHAPDPRSAYSSRYR